MKANAVGQAVPKLCAQCGGPIPRGNNYARKKFCSIPCMSASYRYTPEQAEAAFWTRVNKDAPNECWIYIGHRNKDNYGAINIRGSQYRLAHRYTWALARGDVPDGYHVLHRCDNPPCVNPAHLWLGTDADNCQDMYAKGRDRSRGEKNVRAKLTEAEVLEIRPLKGKVSSYKLAEQYGVTYGAILKIWTRDSWKHLP